LLKVRLISAVPLAPAGIVTHAASSSEVNRKAKRDFFIKGLHIGQGVEISMARPPSGFPALTRAAM
jgi:hypothetical protein